METVDHLTLSSAEARKNCDDQFVTLNYETVLRRSGSNSAGGRKQANQALTESVAWFGKLTTLARALRLHVWRASCSSAHASKTQHW